MANNHIFLSNLSHHTWVRFSYHLPFISYQFISPGLVPSWPTMTRFSLPSDTASIVKWSVWRTKIHNSKLHHRFIIKRTTNQMKDICSQGSQGPNHHVRNPPGQKQPSPFHCFYPPCIVALGSVDLLQGWRPPCSESAHCFGIDPTEKSVVLNLCVWRKQADFMQPLNSDPTRDQGHMPTLTCPFLRSDLWMYQ